MRYGLLLSFAAVCLQIAVFLQPLLPKQYQIAPVCETITRALFQQPQQSLSMLAQSSDQGHQHHSSASISKHTFQDSNDNVGHDHHDPSHQCQYCTVFGNLVLPPEMSVKEVLIRIQVRLVAFQKAFKHVYFVLQRLFLIPQGRAPPLFA